MNLTKRYVVTILAFAALPRLVASIAASSSPSLRIQAQPVVPSQRRNPDYAPSNAPSNATVAPGGTVYHSKARNATAAPQEAPPQAKLPAPHPSSGGQKGNEAREQDSSSCELSSDRPILSLRWCFDHHAEHILGRLYIEWYLDYKLWLGFAVYCYMIGGWYWNGYCRSYAKKGFFAFAMNLLVLHIVQYNSTKLASKLVSWLILNNVFFVYFFWTDVDVIANGGFVCRSLYQDLGVTRAQAFFCFLGQAGLMTLYLEALGRQVQSQTISYWYWFLAFFAMQMTAYFSRGEDSYLGQVWPTSEWYSMVKNAHKITVIGTGYDGKELPPFKVSKADVFARFVFGFVINNTCRDILAYSVPILLSHFNDPLNFVVYCVGCNFITTLDDMREKKFTVQEDGAQRFN